VAPELEKNDVLRLFNSDWIKSRADFAHLLSALKPTHASFDHLELDASDSDDDRIDNVAGEESEVSLSDGDIENEELSSADDSSDRQTAVSGVSIVGSSQSSARGSSLDSSTDSDKDMEMSGDSSDTSERREDRDRKRPTYKSSSKASPSNSCGWQPAAKDEAAPMVKNKGARRLDTAVAQSASMVPAVLLRLLGKLRTANQETREMAAVLARVRHCTQFKLEMFARPLSVNAGSQHSPATPITRALRRYACAANVTGAYAKLAAAWGAEYRDSLTARSSAADCILQFNLTSLAAAVLTPSSGTGAHATARGIIHSTSHISKLIRDADTSARLEEALATLVDNAHALIAADLTWVVSSATAIKRHFDSCSLDFTNSSSFISRFITTVKTLHGKLKDNAVEGTMGEVAITLLVQPVADDILPLTANREVVRVVRRKVIALRTSASLLTTSPAILSATRALLLPSTEEEAASKKSSRDKVAYKQDKGVTDSNTDAASGVSSNTAAAATMPQVFALPAAGDGSHPKKVQPYREEGQQVERQAGRR
jgi:hypothetical protein